MSLVSQNVICEPVALIAVVAIVNPPYFKVLITCGKAGAFPQPAKNQQRWKSCVVDYPATNSCPTRAGKRVPCKMVRVALKMFAPPSKFMVWDKLSWFAKCMQTSRLSKL